MATEYKHSGAMGNALWSVPVFAVPATLVAALVYGYVCVYNPSEKLAVFLAIGYGALIAYLVSRAGKSAKCRSTMCMNAMGFAFGLFALYASWVCFIYALLNRFGNGGPIPTLVGLFFSPDEVWNIMQDIGKSGWFSLSGSMFNGTLLWISWGIEALTILGFSTFMPAFLMGDWVFCEPCNKWCAEKGDIARFGTPEPGAQMDRVKAGDLTVLGELPPDAGGQTPHIRLNNRRCESCGQTDAVEIKRYWYVQTNKGPNEKSEVLRSNMLLDEKDLNELQAALAAKPQPKISVAPTITPPSTM